jgi:hypothetical protein
MIFISFYSKGNTKLGSNLDSNYFFNNYFDDEKPQTFLKYLIKDSKFITLISISCCFMLGFFASLLKIGSQNKEIIYLHQN